MDVLSVKGRDVSQIEGAENLEELYRAFCENVPKSKKEKHIIDRNEFMEEWDESSEEWDSGRNNIENPVGEYAKSDNREREE